MIEFKYEVESKDVEMIKLQKYLDDKNVMIKRLEKVFLSISGNYQPLQPPPVVPVAYVSR